MGKIEIYVDASGDWRWRLKSSNGRIIADSAEGYKRSQGVSKAVNGFVKATRGKLKIKTIKSVPIPAPVPEPAPEVNPDPTV